jgi:hypothetical protein
VFALYPKQGIRLLMIILNPHRCIIVGIIIITIIIIIIIIIIIKDQEFINLILKQRKNFRKFN